MEVVALERFNACPVSQSGQPDSRLGAATSQRVRQAGYGILNRLFRLRSATLLSTWIHWSVPPR